MRDQTFGLQRRALLLFPASTVLGAACNAQPALKWPIGPVRFVVPFPAGAAPDVLIRFIGVKLSETWGSLSSSITNRAAAELSA